MFNATSHSVVQQSLRLNRFGMVVPYDSPVFVFQMTVSVKASERVSPALPPNLRPDEVLVAVPALNEAGHIEACLDSLIGTDPFMAQVRVIVADGGSQDETVAIVKRLAGRYPNLRCIANPKRLQSAAVNKAFLECADPTHRYLVRCDAHAAYPPGYVHAVAESLVSHPDAASVATSMDAVGQGCMQRAAAWIVDTPLGSGGSAHRGGQLSGWVDHAHHAGFHSHWFRKVGGYDESFSHNEDAEFDHRLGLAGGRVWLDADIRLDYQMRNTLKGLWLQYWRYGRGRARTVVKHRMRPRLRQMLPVAAVLAVSVSVVLGMIWPPAFLIVAIYLALMATVSVTAVVTTRSPCGMFAGLAMAAIHLAWGAGFMFQFIRSGRPG